MFAGMLAAKDLESYAEQLSEMRQSECPRDNTILSRAYEDRLKPTPCYPLSQLAVLSHRFK